MARVLVGVILAAGGTVLVAPGVPASAAVSAVLRVPCQTTALADAISNAADGDTLSLASRCRYVLSAELPDIGVSMTIEGHGATIERSAAPGTPSFSDLSVNGTTSFPTVTIDNLNIRNGDFYGGGGIANDFGSLTVNGGTFSGNMTEGTSGLEGVGGGISNNTSESNLHQNTMTINGATFTGNSARFGGAVANFATATITNCSFRSNAATIAGGGFFAIASASISGGDFTGNTSANGGAIYTVFLGGGLGISGTTFTANHASGGGAISGNAIGIDGSRFVRNSADEGGALINSGDDSVSHSVFSGNRAVSDGGAIENYEGQLSVTDSTLTGNSAGGNGGAIASKNPDALRPVTTLSVTGGVIEHNTARVGGGGIYSGPIYGTDTFVTLSGPVIKMNSPDNCSPQNMIAGCVR